jgi:hypothetical protein
MSSTTVSANLEDYTVAWIAALSHERAAGEMMFDQEYEQPKNLVRNANDPNRYSWAIGVRGKKKSSSIGYRIDQLKYKEILLCLSTYFEDIGIRIQADHPLILCLIERQKLGETISPGVFSIKVLDLYG